MQQILKMAIRLQKYLAEAGIASRRKCEELILQGKVKVNGKLYEVQLEEVNEVAKEKGSSYLSADGVHPSDKGHELIMNEWIKAFNEIK